MEKNIHDDQLDDYVRKSFEDYEENPSNNMWGRIEGELPPRGVALLWQRYRWQAAAATILLLLSGLVYEHYYYEQKIQALSVRPAYQITVPLAKPGSSSLATSEKETPVASNLERRSATASVPQKAADRASGAHSGALHAEGQTPARGPRRQQYPGTLVSETLVPQSGSATNTGATSSTAAAPVAQAPPLSAQADTLASVLKITGATLPLPGLPIVLRSPTRAPQLLAQPPIRPLRAQRGWYAGVQAMPGFDFEKTVRPVRRPGGRPVFVSEAEDGQFSTDFWLKVGKKVHKRLALESGLGYREITRTTTHTPRFRFGEGVIHSGGPHQRNFNYDLNAYGGSMAVTLRVQEVDTTAPAPDDEPVSVKIWTSERAQILRIPLLAAYQLGTGRLHGVLKGGLVGHIFLKNEMEIAAQVSQSARFQVAQVGSGALQFSRSGGFFLGYWASLGAEFRWGRAISLVAEPVIAGDFARKDAAGRPLPGQVSVGLNAGLNYYF